MFGGHVITLFYWLKNERSLNDVTVPRLELELTDPNVREFISIC